MEGSNKKNKKEKNEGGGGDFNLLIGLGIAAVGGAIGYFFGKSYSEKKET